MILAAPPDSFTRQRLTADDRIGSKHPTVKPLDLMQYLVRLVTPKGGTVIGSICRKRNDWRGGIS